jgi:hypothetical protein
MTPDIRHHQRTSPAKQRTVLTLSQWPTSAWIAAVLIGTAVGFLATGLLAGYVDWAQFRQSDALSFMSGFAQLVVAAAVFVQLRAARQDLSARKESEEANSDRAQALVVAEFLGVVNNGNAAYVQLKPLMRRVRSTPDTENLVTLENAVDAADDFRQETHRAILRLRVLLDEEDADIGDQIAGCLDKMHGIARSMVVWGKDLSRQPLDEAKFENLQEASRVLVAHRATLLDNAQARARRWRT